MTSSQDPTCPFCGFREGNEYRLLLHVELSHSESGTSPFAVADTSEPSLPQQEEVAVQDNEPDHSSQDTPGLLYVECPHKCGERIHASELQFHVDFHLAEDMALDEMAADSESEASTAIRHSDEGFEAIPTSFSTNIPAALRRDDRASSRTGSRRENVKGNHSTTQSLKELFFGSHSKRAVQQKQPNTTDLKVKRLGRSELGPYAHENRMPGWLQRMLEDDPKVTIYNKIGPGGNLIRVENVANETPHLISVLARLSQQDSKVARAFYCSTQVRHVAKMRREGGFCGYRNIQMLLSYIRDAQAPGVEHFQGRLPSIIKLQDLIEQAWDKGFNAIGRIETGGIKLTRKYIGTPEAQALFRSLDIPCETYAFTTTTEAQAYVMLLQAIFDHFDDQSNNAQKVVTTHKPPIYFQHRGHSMTIVGVEVQNDGNANLVVFDPMFNPSDAIKRLIDHPRLPCRNPATLLRAHRRGERYLAKYKDFEILKVRGPSYQTGDEDGLTIQVRCN